MKPLQTQCTCLVTKHWVYFHKIMTAAFTFLLINKSRKLPEKKHNYDVWCLV